MIDNRAEAALDSLVVNYNVLVNAKTNKPLVNYKVDETGIVHEVKSEVEQIEAELGLPKEKIPTREEQEEAERTVIDEFIMSELAPSYDDLPYDFLNIIKRKYEGETYMKMATELEISSGKIVELIDQYRKRVAPLAIKWDEWRKAKNEVKPEKETDASGEQDNANVDSSGGSETANESESAPEPENNDQRNEAQNETEHAGDSEEIEVSREKLEKFILSGQAPTFEEIPYDFPALLARKKNGESWIKIASSLGISSGALQGIYSKYKKLLAPYVPKDGDQANGAA